MSLSVLIIITIAALVLSGLFSGTEIAFVQSDKVKMEIDAARGGTINKIIRRFSHHQEMFISTMLVGNNVVLVVYGITFSMLLNPVFEIWFDNNEALVLIVNTIVSTSIVLIAGEFLPKTAFRINPNFMIRLFALPLYIIYWILYPVSLLVSKISRGLMKLFGINGDFMVRDKISMDELDNYLQTKIENATSETVENEVKIFSNAIDFKDTQISECMIPRNEIVAVEINSITREELMHKFIATGLSKVVVYKDDIDNILGYIHISELFNINSDWRTKLHPVIFTPETMLANRMMRRLIAEKKSMCIIVDEFGGTAGLVTLEDLVEEIFGEIEDEHDRKKSLVKDLGEGVYEVNGRAEIESLDEDLGLKLPEEDDYHTLGGYILDALGELPDEGETFERDGLKFTILKMQANRIELVRIEKQV